MNVHHCPLHGEEQCLMGEKARNHGCRNGVSLAFPGPTLDREILVVTYLRRVFLE